MTLRRSNLVEKDGVMVNEELLAESVTIHRLQNRINWAIEKKKYIMERR